MADMPVIAAPWANFVPSIKSGKHLSILERVEELRNDGKIIYPDNNNIFRALELTAPQEVKVIILGQDPYHAKGQAHGLCFSVPSSVKTPPSLRNIFLEMNSDLYNGQSAIKPENDLSRLARQGVLLLNTVLTVEEGRAQSHGKLGWQSITYDILQSVAQAQVCAVLLWGKPAAEYAEIFAASPHDHLVLKAAHPSPLSAHRGFFGCKHFSKVNAWLLSQNKSPIAW